MKSQLMWVSVLPYYPQPILEVFGLRFHAFGALVAMALLSGSWVFLRRCRAQGLDADFAKVFIFSVAAIGYFASYFLKVILYAPLKFLHAPGTALSATSGIYSFGGLVGGLATAAWLMHRRRISPVDRLRYLDNLTFAFVCGWIFGRTGCTLSHDHVGIASNSWLAIRFPEGPRYDLGLLELLFTIILLAVFIYIDHGQPPGLYLGLFFFTYGVFRVWRDTLEVHQERFLGLSTDSGFAIACVVGGAIILGLLWQRRPATGR